MTNQIKEQIISDIAKKHFDVPTLEVRNLDRLDFYDVGVGSMRAALNAAFEAGRQSVEK